MTDITETQVLEMKRYFTEKKVLFMTNATALPASLYVASLKTYIDYIPIHNLWIANGIRDDRPYYGTDVFLDMIARMFSDRVFMKFDYVIYIDEDCFITDFYSLYKEFRNFADNNEYCIGGVQDGGILYHRNNSRLMINTFLSFWNISAMRERTTPMNFIDYVNHINDNKSKSLIAFVNVLKSKNVDLLNRINNDSKNMISLMKEFRENHLKGVRLDCVDTHTIPSYSCCEDRNETQNVEDVYSVIQSVILCTNLPVYYMRGADYYDRELSDEETDNSGLTSMVLDSDNKMFAVHTWYARVYSKYPMIKEQLSHTERINKIISQLVDL